MAIKLDEYDGGTLLHVTASGILTHHDYERFIPEFERLASEHGKIRILFEMRDFHGWQGQALWDEIKMDVKHSSDVEKVAMVGDRKWEKIMTMLGKPLLRPRFGILTCQISPPHNIGLSKVQRSRAHARANRPPRQDLAYVCDASAPS